MHIQVCYFLGSNLEDRRSHYKIGDRTKFHYTLQDWRSHFQISL
ncbi:hypothetical protein VB774_15860 [Pseudanabaena galeata UHCC 0370]|uniref:Transposase n=1 Tax=Pseudanabaena galeata UHCC 0370 TaxID=3110310 RepID=A0ABU5TLX6_9CYAN|nr:hypothetical protein [Pseudanabaena galeata]MEA5479097.1 hypothetical protein [Pseudanabaena galeata UHCC 0370]